MATQPFLEDVRVLDLTQLLPGPYATTTLADLGAEVIKVERPDGGDPVRDREPRAGDRSYTLLTRNRTKKSIAINLKSDRGKETFLDLVETADAVVESFRPGVVDRLGVGYDDVRAVNEDIVYCSISGYGSMGPYADRPGHDLNYIGVAGLLGQTGEQDGQPIIPGYPVADYVSGIYAALGITSALLGVRSGTGGDHVDVSMTDTVASFAMGFLDRYDGRNETPARGDTATTGYHPGYRVYEAADGSHITIAALEEHFWENLCNAINTPEFKEHHIGPNEQLPEKIRTEIIDTISDRIGSRPADEWLDAFDRHDVPAGPVHEYDELFEDPHLNERGLFDHVTLETPDGTETIKQIDTPLQFRGDRKTEKTAAPRLGSHTAEILSELGHDSSSISELDEDGVVSLEQPY